MRHHLLIAAIFLLAGAIVNVAVAWGCAAWSRAEGSANTTTLFLELIEGGTTVDPVFSGVGLRIDFVYIESVDYTLELRVRSGWPLLATIEPSWKHYQLGPMPRRRVRPDLNQFEREFLTCCIRARHYATTRPRQVFATHLVWPGFAVNTIFYAAFLWLLIPGPFALRRFIRIRRGLCPACAYPRGESEVCSECGKALPNRVEA